MRERERERKRERKIAGERRSGTRRSRVNLAGGVDLTLSELVSLIIRKDSSSAVEIRIFSTRFFFSSARL